MGAIVEEAARITDPIEHSHALAGIIAGVVVGAIVGVAIVATGGAAVAVAAVVVAGCTGASFGGMIGELAGSLWTSKAGEISSGAETVFIHNLKAARAVADTVDCHSGEHIAQGSETVSIEKQPAARKGDKTTCDGTISAGFPRVLVGTGRATYLPINSEVPLWLELGVMALGLVGGVGEIAMAARGAKLFMAARLGGGLVAGTLGGAGANWLGGKIFGEGSKGQKILAFTGGLAAGMLGSRAAGKGLTSYREGVARDFYMKEGLTYDRELGAMRPFKPSEVDSHLRGIDFRHPVRVIDNPPGELGQIQGPGGRQGQYYAADGTRPTNIGIGDLGTTSTGGVAPKQSVLYSVPEGKPALRTTAASIDDTWSVKGLSQPSEGGATQYYIPDANGITPLSGARPLAPEALTTLPTFPTPPTPPTP